MHLEKEFEVRCERDTAVELLSRDDTLVDLFPDAETEIVAKKGDRKTTRSRYKVLGREGEATFHFDYLLDGNVRFEKVCDGRTWKELRGEVSFEERGGKTRVRIAMDGRTKGLIPEFAIKGPMQEQIDSMAKALKRRLEQGAA